MNTTDGLLASPTPGDAGARQYKQIFFALFLSMGILLPFFAILFRDIGLTAAEIGIASLSFPISRLLVPPLAGILSDSRFGRVRVIRLASVSALLVFPLFYYVRDLTSAIALLLAYSSTRGPLISLLNSISMDYLREKQLDYSRVRLWGSVGFIVGAMSGGVWVHFFGIRHLPIIFGASLLFLIPVSWHPPMPQHNPHAKHRPTQAEIFDQIRRLFRRKEVIFFFAAVFFSRMAEGVYNVFYSMHVVDLGFPNEAAGYLWSVGVLSEVVVMYYAANIQDKFDVGRVFAFTLACGAIRWFGIAEVSSLPALLVFQVMHGVTFGLFYVVAISIVHQWTATEIPATGQTLFDTVGYGFAGIFGQLLAGPTYDHLGGEILFLGAGVVAALSTVTGILFSIHRQPMPHGD